MKIEVYIHYGRTMSTRRNVCNCWTLVKRESTTIGLAMLSFDVISWFGFEERSRSFDKLRLLTGQGWMWEAYERHLSGTSWYEYEKHKRENSSGFQSCQLSSYRWLKTIKYGRYLNRKRFKHGWMSREDIGTSVTCCMWCFDDSSLADQFNMGGDFL